MVDSGNNARAGPAAYIAAYSTMVDASMARQPQAEVQAFWVRQGNKVNFSVQVKNLSGKTLSSSNDATVHAIVYQQQHLQLTGRYVVSAVKTSISSLANGATGTYTLQTGDLIGVDWSKLHYIALVDYIPNSTLGKYDMLQAAEATLLPEVQPEQLVFLVDNDDTSVPSQSAQVQGPSSLTWNASESAAWLSVSPGNGTPATLPQFSVSKAALAGGWQQAIVSFSSPDGALSDQVTVKAYLGELVYLFLPMTAK
jgi:hypothetical protein